MLSTNPIWPSVVHVTFCAPKPYVQSSNTAIAGAPPYPMSSVVRHCPVSTLAMRPSGRHMKAWFCVVAHGASVGVLYVPYMLELLLVRHVTPNAVVPLSGMDSWNGAPDAHPAAGGP